MPNNQLQKQASQHFLRGEYGEAVTWYDRACQSDPNCMSNYWYLGLALLLAGEEALGQGVWLSVLASANVEDSDGQIAELVDVLSTQGDRCLQKGELESAEIIYRQLVEVNNEKAEFYYYLANAIAYQGKEDEAIATWRRAVELKPDFCEVYRSLASLFRRLKEFNNAIPCYLKIVEIKPDCYRSYYNLGLCFCQVNKLVEGIDCFRACLKIKPDYTPALGDLGISLLRLGKLEEAMATLQGAISLASDFREIYGPWREGLCRIGKDNETINFNANFLTGIQKRSPRESYFWLGELLARKNILNLAIICYQKALEVNKNRAEIYLKLREALTKKGDIEGAIGVYKQSLDIVPELAAENAFDFGKFVAGDIGNTLPKITNQNPPTVPTPRGFYRSALNWAIVNSKDSSNYLQIYPENTLELRPPLTPDAAPHFSFRFGNRINLPATFVATIPKGRYWLDEQQTTSAVIASDNKILGDISPQFPVFSPGHPEHHPSKNRIFTLKHLPPFKKIKGKLVVLSGILNDTYFHWMFDILPRVELLRRSGIDFNEVDKFLVNNSKAFQRETLEKLGISENKILGRERHRHIQATNLIVPSFPGSIAWMPKWACDFLRREFLPPKAEINEKIERLYISRKDAGDRRVINEEEIASLLAGLGFQSVALESMSVTQQAALLANAKTIVSPHGSALTNLVFCNKGTKVIEIFSPEYVYHCYWLVSNILGLEYYYFLGERPEGFYLHQFLNPNPRLEDIFVDADKLLDILKFAGVGY